MSLHRESGSGSEGGVAGRAGEPFAFNLKSCGNDFRDVTPRRFSTSDNFHGDVDESFCTGSWSLVRTMGHDIGDARIDFMSDTGEDGD
jgi:hypothetical protein